MAKKLLNYLCIVTMIDDSGDEASVDDQFMIKQKNLKETPAETEARAEEIYRERATLADGGAFIEDDSDDSWEDFKEMNYCELHMIASPIPQF